MSVRLVLLAWVLAPPPTTAAQSAAWTEAQEPFAIAEGLYWVGSAGLGAFLFTSDAGHVLVDAPMQENVDLVLGNVRRLGFEPGDIRIHLLSHAHFDHAGGLAGLRGVTGGELRVSEPDAAFVASGTNFGFDGDRYPPSHPTGRVAHLETIRVGDISLTAHLTPGHTPGCTTWSGSVEIEGQPYRVVIACSLSVLTSYEIVGPDSTYPGHGIDYCRSLDHLDRLDPEIFLTGHAEFFDMEAKLQALREGDATAFVEGERYRVYLSEARAAVEQALDEQGHSGGCASLTAGPG